MAELKKPDRVLLEEWLQDIHVEHYLCQNCEGLHINALQGLEGVANSRIFALPASVVFTTELEVRPMAVLPLSSELGRINMDYPSLKIFLDVVDDATPQLVLAAQVLISAGITQQQFSDFVANTLDGARLLAEECLQLDFLFAEAVGSRGVGSRSLH